MSSAVTSYASVVNQLWSKFCASGGLNFSKMKVEEIFFFCHFFLATEEFSTPTDNVDAFSVFLLLSFKSPA